MTFPQQPAPFPGPPYQPAPPTQPKKLNRHLLIGLAAGLTAGLVLGCCGGVAIGGNDDKKAAPAPAAMATLAPAPSAVPTTPTAAPTTPAAPSTTIGTPTTPAAAPVTTGPALIVMPNVVGQNAAVAADRLRKLGFTEIQYGTQDKNDSVVLLPTNWTVVKQSSKAGSKVPVDTLIVLTCTKEG